MPMHSSFRYHRPAHADKGHPGQAHSYPRKRARQRENRAWLVAAAAKAGMTTLKFTQLKAQESASMGVARVVVRMGPGPAPEQQVRRAATVTGFGSRGYYGNYN